MATVVLTTEGFEEAISRLQQSGRYIAERIKKPLAVMERVRGEMQRSAPRVSGALANSITLKAASASASSGSVSAEIQAGVRLPRPYDFWQEYGTAKMASHPFFWQAAAQNKEVIAREYAEAVEDIVQFLAGKGGPG